MNATIIQDEQCMKIFSREAWMLFGTTGPRGGRKDGLVQTMAKSAVRTVGTNVGKEILRGVLGGIFGGGSKRRGRKKG